MKNKYNELSVRVAEIDKNLRAYRLRSVLERLALKQNKSKWLIKSESQLEAALMRPVRSNVKIDSILEELECALF